MSVSSVSDNTISSYTSSTTGSAVLGKDDFLTLLVAQLKNQDPLDPQDNTDFVAQIAQFSSLEQQITTNEKLDALLEANQAIAQLSAFSLLNQTAVLQQENFTLGSSGSVEFGFSLDNPAASVTMAVLNDSGDLVATIDLDEVNAGNTFVTWDGCDNNGNRLATGEYSLQIVATYDDGGSELLDPLQRARVTGVDTSNGTVLETTQGNFLMANLVSINAG